MQPPALVDPSVNGLGAVSTPTAPTSSIPASTPSEMTSTGTGANRDTALAAVAAARFLAHQRHAIQHTNGKFCGSIGSCEPHTVKRKCMATLPPLASSLMPPSAPSSENEVAAMQIQSQSQTQSQMQARANAELQKKTISCKRSSPRRLKRRKVRKLHYSKSAGVLSGR